MVFTKEDIMMEATLASDITRIQTVSDMLVESFLDQMVEADNIDSFFEAGGNALEAVKKAVFGTLKKIIDFLHDQLEKLSDKLSDGELESLMKEEPVPPSLPPEYQVMIEKCNKRFSPKLPDMKEFFKLMQDADAVMDKYTKFIEDTSSHVISEKSFHLFNFNGGKKKWIAFDPEEIEKTAYKAICEYGEAYNRIEKCLKDTRPMQVDDVYQMAEHGMKSIKELRAYEKKLRKFNDYLIKSFDKLGKLSGYGPKNAKSRVYTKGSVEVSNNVTTKDSYDHKTYESVENPGVTYEKSEIAMFYEAEETAGAISAIRGIMTKLMSGFNSIATKHARLAASVSGVLNSIKSFLKARKDEIKSIVAKAKSGKKEQDPEPMTKKEAKAKTKAEKKAAKAEE